MWCCCSSVSPATRKIETAVAGNFQKQAQARQNAQLALDVALAQLQKHAGPDPRVTATADSFGGSSSTRHYAGVWDATASGADPVAWLVSGNEINPLARTPTSPGASTVELVGRQTTGTANAVLAPLVALTSVGVPGQAGATAATIGRYAWWIGDQGVKAPIAATDKSAFVNYPPFGNDIQQNELGSRIGQQIALGAGPANFEPRDAVNSLLVPNLKAANQLAFLRTPGGTPVGLATLQANFAAWSPNNFNVLSDTAGTGLRRDLSLVPGLLGAGFVAWANYSDARGGYMENFTAPLLPTPRPDYSADPLRRRYRMTARTVENGIEHRVAPVLSFFGLGVSLRNDASNNTPSELQVSLRCVVGLWNPYSSALVPEDLQIVVKNLPTLAVRDTLTGVLRSVSLESNFSNPDGEVKFALPFSANTDPDDPLIGDPDRSSWLPGRVYNWSAPSTNIDPPLTGIPMQFYTRSAVVGSGGVVRPAGAPIGPNTVAGEQNYRIVEADAPRTLTIELRRASTGEVLGSFRSPLFESFTTAAETRRVGDLSDDLAYLFRLPDRAEIPASESRPWLEAPGRDPREFQFPLDSAEGFVVPGNDPQPAALVNPGATSFVSSNSQLLLDRYTSGRDFNEDAPVFELPRAPLLSMGSLQHLLVSGARPFSVGNSWGGDRNAWFDRYFFSGLTPETLWNDTSKPLPNPQLFIVRRKSNGDSVTADDLSGADRQIDGLSGKHLLQRGSFNLNSVSTAAWSAVLRGVRFVGDDNFAFHDVSTSTGTGSDSSTVLNETTPPLNSDTRVAGFPRFAQSAQETFAATDGYLQSDPDTAINVVNTPLFRRGVRFLALADLNALSQAIVALVRLKHEASGPFRTLQEFLAPNELFLDATGGQISLLEKAIADANINVDASLNPIEFSSQFLTQADIMTALAPVLFPRSDTFVIRTYGEAVNPATGATEGRAWAEATVQRTPEYFDPADDATLAPADLTREANKTYGRRFKVVSFRWLTRSDL